jgi:hypothetical protein
MTTEAESGVDGFEGAIGAQAPLFSERPPQRLARLIVDVGGRQICVEILFGQVMSWHRKMLSALFV